MITRTAYRNGTRGGRMWFSFMKDRALANERMLDGEEHRMRSGHNERIAANRAVDLAAVRAHRADRRKARMTRDSRPSAVG